MSKQIQAEVNLQNFSHQLTRYLEGWIKQDRLIQKKLSKKPTPVTRNKEKQVKKDSVKEKAEVSRIQLPIIEEIEIASVELKLPPIKMSVKGLRQNESLYKRSKSQLKLCSPNSILQSDKKRKRNMSCFKIPTSSEIRVRRSKSEKMVAEKQIQRQTQLNISKMKSIIQKQLKMQKKTEGY